MKTALPISARDFPKGVFLFYLCHEKRTFNFARNIRKSISFFSFFLVATNGQRRRRAQLLLGMDAGALLAPAFFFSYFIAAMENGGFIFRPASPKWRFPFLSVQWKTVVSFLARHAR